MKAPWPAGAKVGDVLELPAIPVWAAGKCRQVGDDVALTMVDNSDYVAPAVFVVNPADGADTLTGDGSGVALPPIDQLPVIDEPKAKAKK